MRANTIAKGLRNADVHWLGLHKNYPPQIMMCQPIKLYGQNEVKSYEEKKHCSKRLGWREAPREGESPTV